MEICKKGQAVNYASLEIWHEIKKNSIWNLLQSWSIFSILIPSWFVLASLKILYIIG